MYHSDLFSDYTHSRAEQDVLRVCVLSILCGCMHYLVLSEAALLLLLVVDSESELDRGRRGSFLYTRKLSVTGWFPPTKPLLGKPGRAGESQSSMGMFWYVLC